VRYDPANLPKALLQLERSRLPLEHPWIPQSTTDWTTGPICNHYPMTFRLLTSSRGTVVLPPIWVS
jgi:hypothetical protein